MLEKTLRDERLRHKTSEDEKSRELDRMLAEHRNEMGKAEEAWKAERKHLEALMADLRQANQRMKHEMYDAIENERERAVAVESEKSRETDNMRGRLSVFVPHGARR